MDIINNTIIYKILDFGARTWWAHKQLRDLGKDVEARRAERRAGLRDLRAAFRTGAIEERATVRAVDGVRFRTHAACHAFAMGGAECAHARLDRIGHRVSRDATSPSHLAKRTRRVRLLDLRVVGLRHLAGGPVELDPHQVLDLGRREEPLLGFAELGARESGHAGRRARGGAPSGTWP